MQIKQIAAVAIAFGAILPTAVFAQAPTPTVAPTAPAPAHNNNRVNGVVQSFTNGTVTVTSRRNPTPVTFSVDATTKIHTVADIMAQNVTVNSPVRVEGTVSSDGKSIDARRVTVLAALPAKGAKRWGAVTPNGKRVEGTVTGVSPLTVTAGDGTVVTVNPTLTTQYQQETTATQDAIVPDVHVQATLDAANIAREVTITPARQRKHKA